MSACTVTRAVSFHCHHVASVSFSSRWQTICNILMVMMTLKLFSPFSFATPVLWSLTHSKSMRFKNEHTYRRLDEGKGERNYSAFYKVFWCWSVQSSCWKCSLALIRALSYVYFKENRFLYWHHGSGTEMLKIVDICSIAAWLSMFSEINTIFIVLT